MKRRLAPILILVVALSLSPGCASKYGEQRTVVNYYPGCYAPIRDLRDREYDGAKTTAGAAVVGALGGALIGLLASDGHAAGALAGAAAGGVVGAAAGGIYASKQKERDDNIRLASYLQDMDGDISNMDLDAAAASKSYQCYEQAFKRLIADIRERRVSPTVASARYAEIRSGEEEAASIFGGLSVKSQDLQTQYEQAFIQEERALSSPQKASRGASRQATAQLKKARTGAQRLASKKQQFATERGRISSTMSAQDEQINSELAQLRDSMGSARS